MEPDPQEAPPTGRPGRSPRVRPRDGTDLRACVEMLRRSHEVDRYPVDWPVDPAAWLTPPRLLGAWVATVDAQPVGHVALTAQGDAGAEIGRLFVSPAARRRGLAVALLDEATDHAVTLGRRVELTVVEDSVAATGLYERRGWRLVGRAPAPFTWRDGTRPVERRYRAPARG